jgi:hypothetical protein
VSQSVFARFLYGTTNYAVSPTGERRLIRTKAWTPGHPYGGVGSAELPVGRKKCCPSFKNYELSSEIEELWPCLDTFKGAQRQPVLKG